MPRILEQKISVLIFIYLLIIFGYIFSRGFYFTPGLAILFLAAVLLFVYQIKAFYKNVNVDIKNFLGWVLILLISLTMALYGGLDQTASYWYIHLSRTILIGGMILAFLYVFDFLKWSFIYKFRFLALLLIAVALRFLMIFSSPSPYIDVYYIQKIAPKALLSGINPYSIMYPKLYPETPDVFSYEPAVILLNMPAVLVTGDPRYTLVFAEIGTALLLFLMLKKSRFLKGRKSEIAEILPLIFLYNPRSLFILEQAWVDPLIIFLITLFTFLLFFLHRKLLSLVIFGVALATKQYSIFLIPFLMKGGYLKIRNLIVPLGVFLGFTLPFFIWNSADFLHDVVFYNLLVLPRHDSLSLNSLLWFYTGFDIPTAIIIVVGSLLLLVLLKFQKKSPSAVFLATATFSLSIFLIYKLAFIHYFYFAGSLLLLSIVLLVSEPQRVDG